MEPTIRPATIDDVPRIARAAVETVLHARRQGSDPYVQGLPDGDSEPLREWAARFTGGGTQGALVLESASGEFIGCACLAIGSGAMPEALAGRTGTVALLWVAERHRGRGLGRALVRAAEDWFADRDIRHVELSWLAVNADAERFWKRMGYAPFRTHGWKRTG